MCSKCRIQFSCSMEKNLKNFKFLTFNFCFLILQCFNKISKINYKFIFFLIPFLFWQFYKTNLKLYMPEVIESIWQLQAKWECNIFFISLHVNFAFDFSLKVCFNVSIKFLKPFCNKNKKYYSYSQFQACFHLNNYNNIYNKCVADCFS